MGRSRKTWAVAVAVAVVVAVPAAANAHQRMGGKPKATVLYAIKQNPGGGAKFDPKNAPSTWVEQRCTAAFESTVNDNYAVAASSVAVRVPVLTQRPAR